MVENKKTKTIVIAVCPFHSVIPMMKHEVADIKAGKLLKGYHCPKCFCSNPKFIEVEVPADKPFLKEEDKK